MKLRASGEDYLEAVLMLQKKNGMVRSIDLARHMEVSKPSVSRAVAILQEGGFLDVNGKARKIKTYRTFCYLLVSYSPILVLFQHFSDQFYTSIPS